MGRRILRKKLLVEGEEDKRVVPQLIEANGVPWGGPSGTRVVEIKPCGGFDGMVKPGVIETEIKESGLEVIGIIADANDRLERRWKSLRDRCLRSFPRLSDVLPESGLIATNDSGLRLGIWLMPDNRSHGMMQTFLTYLAPIEDDPVLDLAKRACGEAKSLGAPFKDTHADKAKIHTWLAWQNPPGRPLHNAVMERILDAGSPQAGPFIGWFRSLFGL